MNKVFLILIGFLLALPMMAAKYEPTIPDKAMLGPFIYNLEADQEKGTKLDRKYEKQREEKRRIKTEKKSKTKPAMNKD